MDKSENGRVVAIGFVNKIVLNLDHLFL